MGILEKIYNLSPIWFQNIMVTTYGHLLHKQRYGGMFKEYVEEFDKNQSLSWEALEEMQTQKLREMINHAYLNVPYYRSLFDRQGIHPNDIKGTDDLARIHILEKETVKKSPEKFIAQNLKKSSLIKEHTGGTTGSPLTIYVTSKAVQFNFAMGESRIRHWYGTKLGDTTAAFLGRTIVPISQDHPPFWRYNKSWNEYLFSTFHLNSENVRYYIDKLKKINPAIIIGYPTPVYIVARSINDTHQEGFIKPKLIWLSSETLQDYQRKAIEKAFGTKVCNAYSQAELAAFISECPEGGVHISPEYGLTEFIPLKGGETEGLYEIVATGLFNYAMPFIRYRTGDIVTLDKAKKCSCGRELPVVDEIIGRDDNVLVTPQGTCISSAPLSLVFEFCENVEEAQLIQDKNDHIIVRLVKRKSYTPKDEKYLQNELCKRIGSGIKIEFQYVPEIERTKMGKYRFLISEVGKGKIN